MSDNAKGSARRHDERAGEQLAHEAAVWISRESGTQSLITVTRASMGNKGAHATIYVSIFPEEQIRPGLAFLERARYDFGLHLRAHSRIRPIPAVEFLLEDGEAHKPVPLDGEAAPS
jgi:ribosome-binding factor A